MTTENKIIKKIRKKRRTKTGKYKNKKEKNSNKNNILNINNLIPKNSSINKNITKEKIKKIMEYNKEELNQLKVGKEYIEKKRMAKFNIPEDSFTHINIP